MIIPERVHTDFGPEIATATPFLFFRRSALFFLPLFLFVFQEMRAQVNDDLYKNPQNRRMTAVFIEPGKIVLDGRLDEKEWKSAEPATDFIQRLPFTGKPATERTEVFLLYDDENLYMGVHCFDSLGEKGITIKDIRPDFYTLDSDGFQVVFDTFDDDRNCFLFGTNPAAGRFDMQIGSDGSASNTAWNGIWYVKTLIDKEGWHLEMSIPWTTLRFQKAREQQWGVNFERRVRRISEDSYWGPLPAAFRLGRVSLGGTLVGLKDLKPGRNLYLKPYVATPFSRSYTGGVSLKPEAGLDLKYGLSSQWTLDLTVNTDFAQVEADEEQVNLSRYSLFFPEKRDFFLEGASLFKVGRTKAGVSSSSRPDVMPFFTRRIGISDSGGLIPILGGARLTGRTGKYTFSLLNMETDDISGVDLTNYTLVRARRDLFKKSDIGAFFTNKVSQDGEFNRLIGTDANFNFFKFLDISAFLFKTDGPGAGGKDLSSYVEVGWKDDLLDIAARHLTVDENFDPQMGYVARTAIRKTSGDFGLTFRPRQKAPWIRYFGPVFSADYITDPEGNPESKSAMAYWTVMLRSGSEIQGGRISYFERLVKPFQVHPTQAISPGDYRFDENYVSFVSDRKGLFMGSVRIGSGSFYNGDRNTYTLSGDFQPGYQFRAGLSWGHNDVDLPTGSFTTNVLGARLGYAFSTSHYFNALIQYNSTTRETAGNIRLNLFHTPTNDCYLVFNERRLSDGSLLDRALILKLTRIFSF